MAFTSSCAKADEVGLIGHLSPVIGVGDEEDTVAELVEWPRLKGSREECPTGSSRFREFCKAKSSIDAIWGHAFGYRGNFFRTCSFSQGGDYLNFLPHLVKEKKCRRLGDEVSLERITAKDFLEYYGVKYVTTTDGAYLSSSSSRPCFFDLSSAGRVWNDNLLCVSGKCLQRSDEEPLELNNKTITKGNNCKVSRKESFIDAVAREGNEFNVVFKELVISRFKRVASKDDKVRRSQAKRKMAGKTLGSMEEKLSTPELNTPLKLARLNEMPDGPVDVATVSSTIVQNLAKRKAVKRGAGFHSVTSDSVDDNSKRRKEQYRAKAREKMVAVVDDEFMKLEVEKEREAAALKLKEVRAESVAEAEQLVSASATSRNNLAEKLYQLRYTKAKIMAFNEGNYEEKEIMDEQEVEEIEESLNVAKKTAVDNQETIDQEIESSRLRVVDLEGLLEVEKKSSAELQEKATSGSWHKAELAEYLIRALNEEISDMKCNLYALIDQLMKREIDLDTVRTNLAVSEADFEKLSSCIVRKYQELRNSAQIRDSLIARLYRLKADLRHFKEKEA
ncbi:hypothetical protein GIB67_017907 [Kingdonia uniflora]|uniref:Uncharacterized protein n=1 Tax=Kingdonia uniflora TaxID=39325 RepID=A0A7J7NE17_9MAGN|nr:hypothetical protein GIB67_017907 [Kingdonia uniflora]